MGFSIDYQAYDPFDRAVDSLVRNFDRGVKAKVSLQKISDIKTFDAEQIDKMISSVCHRINVNKENSSKVADLLDELYTLKDQDPHLTELPDSEKYLAIISLLYRQYLNEEDMDAPLSDTPYFLGFIKDYGINVESEEGQKVLIEMAKLQIEYRRSDSYQIIQLIKDRNIRFELLQDISKIGFGFSYVIEWVLQCDLTMEQKLVFAKIGATKRDFSTYVHLFDFKDKEFVELAKLALSYEDRVSENIKNYKIEDPELLFEIALLAAQKTPHDLARNIANYKITDKDKLKTLALEAAENGSIAQDVKNFGIKDKVLLFEIAKLCFLAEGQVAARYVENFELTDLNQLAFLAKLGTEADPWTIRYLENFHINDQAILTEIALLAATRDGGFLCELIQNFGIESLDDRIEIFLESMLNNPFIGDYIPNYKLPPEFAFFSHPFFASSVNNYQESLKDLLEKLGLIIEVKVTDEFSLNNLKNNLVLVSYLFILNNNRLMPEVQSLLDLRNPLLRKQIVKVIGKNIDYFKEGSSGSLYEALAKTWEGTLPVFSNKSMKDGVYQQVLFQAMIVIEEDSSLNARDKMALLQQVLVLKTKKEQVEMMKSIIAISSIGRKLKGINSSNYEQVFSDFFQSKVPVGEIKDFTTKYENTLKTFRDPNAVFSYAASLMKLSDYERGEYIKFYASFVRSVLEGQFHDSRYDNSPHLKMIFDHHPELKDAWKNGASIQLGKRTLVDTDDPCDILMSGTEVQGSCQNIIGNPSKNKCLMTYLMDGKNRMIAIKNDKGIIESRAIFRLLLDGEKPVLFLEAAYPPGTADKSVILDFAKKRAAELGLPLMVKMEEDEDRKIINYSLDKEVDYSGTLSSFGGPGLHEYVDANRGIFRASVWSITGTKLVSAVQSEVQDSK